MAGAKDLLGAGPSGELTRDIYAPAAKVTVAGQRLPPILASRISSVEVSQRAGEPSAFSIDLYHPDGDDSRPGLGVFNEGAEVEIELGYVGQTRSVMIGTVTGVTTSFPATGPPLVHVHGFDYLHVLTQFSARRVFEGESKGSGPRDSDVVRKVGEARGFTVSATATEPRERPRVQANVTDYDFLQDLIAGTDRDLSVERGKRLVFGPAAKQDEEVLRLVWGRNLRSFSPQLSEVGQVDAVEVRAWDSTRKRLLVGRAPESQSGTSTGKVLVVDDASVTSEAEASNLARELLARRRRASVRASGSIPGDPSLSVGRLIHVSQVGTFTGRYIVTGSTHTLDSAGFFTSFEAEAMSGATASSLRSIGRPGEWRTSPSRRINGVMPGVVLKGDDDTKLARVLVQLPLLGDDVQLWARVAVPWAGPDRGAHLVPRDGDEVVVAFESGDPSKPCVLGSLWSSESKPPDTEGEHACDVVLLKSHTGHVMRLDDREDHEGVQIVDHDGNGLVVDTEKGEVTLKAGKALTIEVGDGTLTLKAKDVVIKASGSITVESDGASTVKAKGGTLTLKGSTVEIN